MKDRRRGKRLWLRTAAALLACAFLQGCGEDPTPTEVVEFHPLPVATPPPPPPLPTEEPEPPFYLNLTETEIYGGGVSQLVAYSNPGAREVQNAVWTSSDETVAIVEEYGVAIGLSPGTAVITAAAGDGSGDSASCRVTVTSARPQPRETIRLNKYCYKNGKQLFASRVAPIAAFADALDPARRGEGIALAALRYVGNYYGVLEGNIDCSMLLLYACLDNGIRLPRRSDWQAKALAEKAVSQGELQTGDLVFFAYDEGDVCSCRTAPVCTRYLGVHHAAIYLGEVGGERYMVEASSALGLVVVRYWDGSGMHAGLRIVFCARP